MVEWKSRSARSFDAMSAEVVRRQARAAGRFCLLSHEIKSSVAPSLEERRQPPAQRVATDGSSNRPLTENPMGACTVAKFQNTRLSHCNQWSGCIAGTHKPELTGSTPPEPIHLAVSQCLSPLITSPSLAFLEGRAACLLRPCQIPLRLAQPNRAMPCLPLFPRAGDKCASQGLGVAS